MFGMDSSRGFADTELVQLPVCNAVLFGHRDEETVVIRNAKVRTPIDAWEVKSKENGCTVLMAAIKGHHFEMARRLVARSMVKERQFIQETEKVDHLYSSLTT